METQNGKSPKKPTSVRDVINVPGIYVEGESYEIESAAEKNKNCIEKRESSLSTSLDALTASSNSVFSQDNVANLDEATGNQMRPEIPNLAVGELDDQDSLLPLGAYCSPRVNRRQRSGSYPVRDRYPVRDLSSLRAEGYLKFKAKGGRCRVNSGESRESGDTLDNVSHMSTCATSDYAFMTSIDTLNLCQSCTPTQGGSPHRRSTIGRPLSLDVETYTGIRRTHSNPENCQSEQGLYDLEAIPYGTLRSSDKDTEDKASTLKRQPLRNSLAQDDSGLYIEHMETLKGVDFGNTNSALEDILPSHGKRRGLKPVAISEENLVSRVSRWLSTMEQPETRDLDTF